MRLRGISAQSRRSRRQNRSRFSAASATTSSGPSTAWCLSHPKIGSGRSPAGLQCLFKISQTVEGATATPSPASSPAIRRYPQCSLSAAMRNTRRTMRRWVGGRPGRFGLDLAAQRRRTIARCQRRIVPGVMNECSAPWRERGMSVSGAANSARSVQVSLGRAGVCRCRTASWWRSRRISASFHVGGRLDSLSHAGIWTARRNTKRRHTRRDHRPPGCLTASLQHPDDLPVRGCRQPQPYRSRTITRNISSGRKGCEPRSRSSRSLLRAEDSPSTRRRANS